MQIVDLAAEHARKMRADTRVECQRHDFGIGDRTYRGVVRAEIEQPPENGSAIAGRAAAWIVAKIGQNDWSFRFGDRFLDRQLNTECFGNERLAVLSGKRRHVISDRLRQHRVTIRRDDE